MARSIAFIDSEVGINDKKIHDLGAVRKGQSQILCKLQFGCE